MSHSYTSKKKGKKKVVMRACYICADTSEPLVRTCKCDLLVHKECYERAIKMVPAHRHRCPVCREEHNADVFTQHSFHCTELGPLMVLSDCLAVSMWITVGVFHDKDGIWLYVFLPVACVSTIAAAFYHFASWRDQPALFCLRRERVVGVRLRESFVTSEMTSPASPPV